MIRETIDLGIDLGTTNSCVAVCGSRGPEVVRVSGRDYLPSVVYKRGTTTYVGDKAYQAIGDERRWNDVHYEFKRMMGSQQTYSFKSVNINLTAEELAAEVLRELSAAVEERYNERFHAAVITVPAWFESVQREATLRAGQAAGFDEVVLLQEPVAASLGYGFGLDNVESQTWLVFDLGGGTLDVALVESVEGELRVINHIGNNYCGGKDLDWLILEELVCKKLDGKYSIPQYSKNDKFWRLLKPLAEQAKIELSSRPSTLIDTDQDGVETIDGSALRAVVEVTRNEYEQLISDWIDTAIQYGTDLLKECGLRPSKIARTLLAGGPTYTPLLRRRIVERLGIPAEIQAIDPMTVVARGAAVFAGSRKLTNSSITVPSRENDLPIVLHYKPVYADTDPMISGTVEAVEAITALEFVRDDGAWTSGRITLLDGAFITRVILESGTRNTFSIRAFNPKGSQVPVSPSSFSITHGLDVAPPTCPMSYKLPVQDGYSAQMRVIADTLIEKGHPLPCSETRDYRTVKAVKAGSTDEVIRIPIVEGEYDTLDFNRHVGTVLINGDAIERSLPEGSEIHVTLHVDENGIPHVEAYVPFLEKRFGAILTDRDMQNVDHQLLIDNITEDDERMQIIRREITENEEAHDCDKELIHTASQVQKDIMDLYQELPSAQQATAEDLQKIERQRKALAEKINALASSLELPRSVTALQDSREWAQHIVETHGNREDNRLFEDYQQEADKVIQMANLAKIHRVRSEILTIAWRILFKIDDFWIGTFQDMCQHTDRFTNQEQAKQLIQSGRQALGRQNLEELKKAVWQLWDLYPETSRLEASRRFETDLRMV